MSQECHVSRFSMPIQVVYKNEIGRLVGFWISLPRNCWVLEVERVRGSFNSFLCNALVCLSVCISTCMYTCMCGYVCKCMYTYACILCSPPFLYRSESLQRRAILLRLREFAFRKVQYWNFKTALGASPSHPTPNQYQGFNPFCKGCSVNEYKRFSGVMHKKRTPRSFCFQSFRVQVGLQWSVQCLPGPPLGLRSHWGSGHLEGKDFKRKLRQENFNKQ